MEEYQCDSKHVKTRRVVYREVSGDDGSIVKVVYYLCEECRMLPKYNDPVSIESEEILVPTIS